MQHSTPQVFPASGPDIDALRLIVGQLVGPIGIVAPHHCGFAIEISRNADPATDWLGDLNADLKLEGLDTRKCGAYILVSEAPTLPEPATTERAARTGLFPALVAKIVGTATVRPHADYDGRACVVVTMPEADMPHTALISLHMAMMKESHTCIDQTTATPPSILVLAPADSMSDAEGLAYFTAMIATGPTQ